MNSIR